MGEHCADHQQNMNCLGEFAKNLALLQKDIEYMRRDQELILARFGKHVEDAEKDGGWHHRLQKVEDDMKASRYYMIACGVIGGLIGSGATEAVTKFLGIWK